jgi:hypothetical protein
LNREAGGLLVVAAVAVGLGDVNGFWVRGDVDDGGTGSDDDSDRAGLDVNNGLGCDVDDRGADDDDGGRGGDVGDADGLDGAAGEEGGAEEGGEESRAGGGGAEGFMD